ncbi:MAG: lipid A biosynthesis acyltransferase [Bacteroidales bacterium]|nr:lipid A biosynthesis acyltransferase [Bacteroidales bacterium]
MAFSLPVYMIVRPKATLAIWHYFRRRQGFGVFKTFCHLWRNHFGFGQVVVDRFAAYAGKKFSIEVVGHNHYREIEASGRGFMMLSSHIGNHEMAGYDLRAKARLNVLAYGGEVEEVRSGRARLLAENNIRMVPITDGISHIFVLKEALENGEVVDIHGDRLFGSPKAFSCSVLGAPADLPQGPFVLASSINDELPVIAVFCVKVGYRRFKIYIERLDVIADPDQQSLSARERAQVLAQRYADAVSGILLRYPDQWYNFFEFWK